MDTLAERLAPYIECEDHGRDCVPNTERILAEIRADSLDAAWAEAEAALPDGWCLKLHSDVDVDATDYLAIAQPNTEMPRDLHEWAPGPTPAAALRALAVKLRATYPLDNPRT